MPHSRKEQHGQSIRPAKLQRADCCASEATTTVGEVRRSSCGGRQDQPTWRGRIAGRPCWSASTWVSSWAIGGIGNPEVSLLWGARWEANRYGHLQMLGLASVYSCAFPSMQAEERLSAGVSVRCFSGPAPRFSPPPQVSMPYPIRHCLTGA